MLNENIKTLRKNKGFTQEELAIRLHVTRQTVSKGEHGYSVPDAQLLSEMAEIFEVSVSDLLGMEQLKQEEPDALIEQLSRINAQLAIRNRRMHRFWKVLGIILLVLAIAAMVFLFGIRLPQRAETNREAGRTLWQCSLAGKTYQYEITYNDNYQVLAGGGDGYVANHTDVEDCDDANKAAAHLHDYFKEHGGSIKVVKQKGLKLTE